MVRKRPPQGTSRIINLGREETERWRARAKVPMLVALAVAISEDDELCALAEAKAERDTATMGRLIPSLKARYGVEAFTKMFKEL